MQEHARPTPQGRSVTFGVAIGLVIGIAVTGLVIPYVRTESVLTTSATPRSVGTSGPSGETAAPAGTPGGDSSAGGGGAGNDQTAAAGADAQAAPGEAAPGPDRGVSDTEISLGVALIDVGAAKSFGFNFDIGDERARYQALIDAQNAAGGINGRKIVPDYRTFDATNPNAPAQAACIAWTQDVGVFSVLVESQWPAAATVCVTGDGQTPLMTTDGVDQSYYANNMLYTTQASDNRILADQAHYLAETGQLQGKKIGVLTGDGSERLGVDNTLVPTLAQLGYQVADVEVVPATTAGTQKTSVAISNFKANGVDFVIVAANVILAGPFVQSADRAGYHPKYGLSDFNNEINDQVASYYPDSFEGTVAISTHRFPEYRAGAPLAAADQHCADRVQSADPKVLPPTNSAFEVAMGDCAIFDAWVAAATAAGPNLNRASFAAAMEQQGRVAIPSTLDGSFGPGKHDAVDFEREVAWHKSCTCWELVNGLSTPQRQMEYP
jgi:hypothetical protein